MDYILTVTETNMYLKKIIANDILLSNIGIRGEISNYKKHSSGHIYFTLKDDSSLLRCVFFKNYTSMLKFNPNDGMKVIAKGYISIYEKDGQYQLYVREIIQDGIGDLHAAFIKMKEKLEKEGLFEQKYKKSLPVLPKVICVVTSPTGAVIRDIMNVLFRRFPNVHLRIFPVAVQGETAAGEVARAVRIINKKLLGDVIIIARGGGSLEELWAFNEEVVARSVFESSIPVISAVGHETDYTICDFVSDVRAPTPSAAAELVIPEKQLLVERINGYQIRLRNSLLMNVQQKAYKLQKLSTSYVFRQPYDRIYKERVRIDDIDRRLTNGIRQKNEKQRTLLEVLYGKLQSLNPESVVKRGYSIIINPVSGDIVTSIEHVKEGDNIEVKMRDGSFISTVKTKKEVYS